MNCIKKMLGLVPAITLCEPFLGKDGQWYFHARAKNGEVVFQSEAYTRRDSAEKTRQMLLSAKMVMEK